nr:putative integron gene cassette protein [uncultured bacterium]CAP48058.1 putative integron gene cassette protein [uncultured bacterium]CAP48113.1 putative integron gene cassette protein [uncultured bacterium]CAP48142.1 putative integron gene cassette protein [uncultured bacterium]CAP48810.1 putative integron gene cassette protein [uncultured bacterium]
MNERPVNKAERYLLENYQHLMSSEERMIARSLIHVGFDLTAIHKGVWNRVWIKFPGIDRKDPWKLPIRICVRLLSEHRNEVHLPKELL